MTKKDEMPDTVDASPVKSFFVSMLTRDIKLEEAILDLLDNCVDGVLRSAPRRDAKQPFAGFWAHIEFDKSRFCISDNCGGIPWALHEYAFRMGRAEKRPPEAAGTVGVYGIGMKRAIFKIGKECLMQTQNGKDSYEVHITPDWIAREGDWQIPLEITKPSMPKDGTTILVERLNEGIKTLLGDDADAFASDLDRLISTHYAFIIEKGFEVRINRTRVNPRPTKLLFDKRPAGKKNPAVQPFVYRTIEDGVEISLAVGFTRPLPSEEESAGAVEDSRHKAVDAGWTVVCNDRAVLYGDKTELTGWGETTVPRHHPQFNAISGIVEFRGDPLKLPTTTTKRGIDSSSRLYLRTKNKMREGMRMFTDFTNKWKGRTGEVKTHIEAAGMPIPLNEVIAQAEKSGLRKIPRGNPAARQFAPLLPMPKQLEQNKCRISFIKSRADVRKVGAHVLENEEANPSDIGEKCFDMMLQEAD